MLERETEPSGRMSLTTDPALKLLSIPYKNLGPMLVQQDFILMNTIIAKANGSHLRFRVALNLREHCLTRCKEQEQLEQLGYRFKVRGLWAGISSMLRWREMRSGPPLDLFLNRASKIY